MEGQSGTSETRQLKDSIIHALKSGYRLIDTAQHYGVESVVGEAIRESGVPRSEITVITKIWGHRYHEMEKAFEDSLRDLHIEYIDILLMHQPVVMNPDQSPMPFPGSPSFMDAWKRMEKLVGPRCKAIGVSNFTQKLMDMLLDKAEIVPILNQVELHPMNPNFKLVPYCKSKGIAVMSWGYVRLLTTIVVG